jgi:hypothetical protein
MTHGARVALRVAIGTVAMLLVAAITLYVSARRAHARAEAFCAASPPGTPAREVTIHALDQHVQVRTDIEPGALVVRFEAWGYAKAAGECHLLLQGDYVSGSRVERL